MACTNTKGYLPTANDVRKYQYGTGDGTVINRLVWEMTDKLLLCACSPFTELNNSSGYYTSPIPISDWIAGTHLSIVSRIRSSLHAFPVNIHGRSIIRRYPHQINSDVLKRV
jgi:hypothetical protein